MPEPAVVAVFAGDHGVLAEGVSPWPQEVTAQMVANFCAGGAAVNVLAEHVGADVVVVDVGVAGDLPAHPRLRSAKVAPGTANLAAGPAMTGPEARAALDVGARWRPSWPPPARGACSPGTWASGTRRPRLRSSRR